MSDVVERANSTRASTYSSTSSLTIGVQRQTAVRKMMKGIVTVAPNIRESPKTASEVDTSPGSSDLTKRCAPSDEHHPQRLNDFFTTAEWICLVEITVSRGLHMLFPGKMASWYMRHDRVRLEALNLSRAPVKANQLRYAS
ncbi:16466_t:CDS:2 [Acaulospora colombiana]|uniref:16466_t:CDS:1 n=1 Tax=Acaulospora colombiana TaxID=27376 RepID=A0ACA9PBU6_9GLOM|nr:16466_t:CDS:2 [Acaulospora colombiana]